MTTLLRVARRMVLAIAALVFLAAASLCLAYFWMAGAPQWQDVVAGRIGLKMIQYLPYMFADDVSVAEDQLMFWPYLLLSTVSLCMATLAGIQVTCRRARREAKGLPCVT